MNSGTKIRNALKNDQSGITILTNQLGYPSSEEKVSEILDVVLNHDDHQLYVAEVDGFIAGYIHIVCTMHLNSGAFIEIAAIIVHDNYRHQGIGDALLNEAIAWAKDKNYNYIRIRSSLIHDNSHKFFEDHGFRDLKTQDVVVKEIS